jgi:DNA-binding SARP family transcriptional activator/tetratricopeptide (TPR) repeat protein/DNA-binding XRE family transcriptional regulator
MKELVDGVGDLVRRHRVAARLTQRELAGRTGLSVRALRNIERNQVQRPHPQSLHRLATALGLVGVVRDRLLSTSDADTRLRVGVLGPLSVHRGQVPVDLGPHKHRNLLGLLAIQPGQVVSLAEIVDVLWADRPPRTCVGLVHTYVAKLRGLLEPDREQHAPARIVVRVHGGYRLDLADDQLDVLRFADLAAAARRAVDAGTIESASSLFDEALRCWRGRVGTDLCARLRQHPAAVEASRQRLSAAQQWADLAIDRAHLRLAIAQLHAVAIDEPLHEGLHATLMVALARDGQQAAALGLFVEISNRLTEELGVRPGRELHDAHVRVLRQEISGPAGVSAGSVAVGRPPATPAQLPVDVAAFTGRAHHLRTLDALLGPDGGDRHRAVVISAIAGTAGVGKTALAVHWAHRARDRFPDGQLYLNLRGHSPGSPLQPIEALARMLASLGVAVERIPAAADEAAAMYRTLLAARRVLVVLDNAQTADQVRPLLPGDPGCMVVITSRDRLGGLVAREGVRRLTLDVLAPVEAHDLLERLLGADRTRAEPEAIGELARLCANLPLALRIAAANLADHPCRRIANYVAELGAGNRVNGLAIDGDEQSAVRAAFDLSYARLPAQTGRLFRLLGLVPGPDITAAAAALAGATVADVTPHLNRLLAASLIDADRSGRFGFHDLLRCYAADRAEADENADDRAAALRRLFDWYLRGADRAARILYPDFRRLPIPASATDAPEPVFRDQGQARAWLEAELASIAAATVHCANRGPRQVAWLLADSLRGYIWISMRTADWVVTTRAGLSAARLDGDLPGQFATLLSVGDVEQRRNRHVPAIEAYREALSLARRTGMTRAQATALAGLAGPYWRLGRLEAAMEHLKEALAVGQQLGWTAGQGILRANLCGLHLELGRLAEAAEVGEQTLVLHGKRRFDRAQAFALANLGEAYAGLGRLKEARTHTTRAIELHRTMGNRYGEADAQRVLAAVERDAGHLRLALDLSRLAVTAARDIGDQRLEADTSNVHASVHRFSGEYRLAIHHHDVALDVARRTDNLYPQVEALLGLAQAHHGLAHHDQALSQARAALAHARRAGYRLLEGMALTTLAGIHLDRGDLDSAAENGARALAVHHQTGHRLGAARTHVVLGGVLARAEGTAAALADWRAAVDIFTDVGSPEAARVRTLMAAHNDQAVSGG